MNNIQYTNLTKIALSNLDEIIAVGYPSICMNTDDLEDYVFSGNMRPRSKYNQYESLNKGIMAFFNEGKTACYIDWGLDSGYIMLSNDKDISFSSWSPQLLFTQEGDASNIIKKMKLKYFW